MHRTALGVLALLWLAAFPASAPAGYDVAHILQRTCDPGGRLIVADEWKGDAVAQPGEVIACPARSFQIAAGPERIGGRAYLCTYFSLVGGDGADVCTHTAGARSPVMPLMAIQADRSGRMELVGIAGDDVAAVSMGQSLATMVPIGRQRAARLGATRAFRYFSLTVDRRTLCETPRLQARDSSGRRIAERAVPATTALLSTADRVPHARSLDGELCESTWLAKTYAMLRSLVRMLI